MRCRNCGAERLDSDTGKCGTCGGWIDSRDEAKEFAEAQISALRAEEERKAEEQRQKMVIDRLAREEAAKARAELEKLYSKEEAIARQAADNYPSLDNELKGILTQILSVYELSYKKILDANASERVLLMATSGLERREARKKALATIEERYRSGIAAYDDTAFKEFEAARLYLSDLTSTIERKIIDLIK